MADTPSGEPKADDAGGGRSEERRGRRRGGRKGKDKGDQGRPEGERRGPRDGDRRGPGDGDRRGPRDRDRDRGGRGGGKGRDDRNRSDQPLTAGLFAGVADREMPCRISGCKNTWTWYGTQQIRSLGKPEPKRMCTEHLAQFEGIEDRAMPCRNSWCTNTWTWSRGAQLYQRERQEKLKPPHRLCEQCFEEEKTTEDLRIECKIPECRNTWMWPRQAQLRHRAWVRRQLAKDAADDAADDAAEEAQARAEAAPEGLEAKAPSSSREEAPAEAASEGAGVEAQAEAASEGAGVEAPAEAASEGAGVEAPAEAASEGAGVEAPGEDGGVEAESAEAAGESVDTPASDHKQTEVEARSSKKRKRKRKRKRKIHDGPPEKLCERCFERMGHLEPIAVPCKVHGCTDTWIWEREGQLRAWAALDSREEVTELPQPPRRMCNPCFDFVRAHSDREVACGRPGCEKTWTYKTGAQLQDFLAGRTQDPIRLCDECSRSQFVIRSSRGVEMPAGAEVMPCQIAGCDGSWVYTPGMKLSPADPDSDVPVDRMCDDCRDKAGAPGRDPRRQVASVEVAPAQTGADEEPTEPEADTPDAAPAAQESADEPATNDEAPSED